MNVKFVIYDILFVSFPHFSVLVNSTQELYGKYVFVMLNLGLVLFICIMTDDCYFDQWPFFCVFF